MPGYAAEVLADSPLGYWRLDESSGTTLVDASGNGRNGTYTAPPTLGEAGLVADGTSARFTPVDYATVTSSGWMPAANAAMTIEAVIKPNATSSYRNIANQDGHTLRGWNLYLLGGQLHIFEDAVSVTGTSTMSAGTRYHVAATYDGTRWRLYVDGTLETTASPTGRAIGEGDLLIGASKAGTATPTLGFDGWLDEVAFYGSALSGARISAHHAAMDVAPAPSGSGSLVGEGVASASGKRTTHGSGSLVGVGLASASDGIVRGSASLVGEGLASASGAAVFVPFEPPTVGAGFPLRFSARLSPPLSVDVDDVVPFRKVASSVSEDV